MRRRFITTSVLAAGVLAASLVTTAAAAEGIAAEDLGLTKGPLLDTPVPPEPNYTRGMPGTPSAKPLPPVIPGAPAQIPHAVANFLPVTVDHNACLGCHSGKTKVAGMGTPIPESHYKDLRSDAPAVQAKIDGSRYICTTCHAPQADNPDLVSNTFSK